MLTRCVEKGREKCDHYWPYDTQPVFYGDIQVTILNESHFPGKKKLYLLSEGLFELHCVFLPAWLSC